MDGVLYQRIKDLCAERGISIRQLEFELGFGNASIKKWKDSTSPSVDKVMKIASYFDVSLDYLLGRSELKGSLSDIINDEDVISFQRAREKMTPNDRKRMMRMLKLGFEEAFSSDTEGDDNT